MADLSPLSLSMSRVLAIDLESSPWLADHTVEGRIVLPAVAAMQLLAIAVREKLPGQAVHAMERVNFPRFLPLAEAQRPVALWAEFSREGTRCLARLVSRGPTGRAGIVRPLVHAALTFGPLPESTPPPPVQDPPPADCTIASARVYDALVPLGSAFRNLRPALRLWPASVLAEVDGGSHPGAGGPLGAPFPLDAAFHAACVWCQRYAGIVAYPVAMDWRFVLQPTCSGGSYRAQVVSCGGRGDALCFDLWMADAGGALCEVVLGLEMRDVSGGRRRPPEWLRRLPLGVASS